MQRSTDRIFTTHVGKLSAPDDLVQAMPAHPQGRPTEPSFGARLRTAVADVVHRQADIGIASWRMASSAGPAGTRTRAQILGAQGLTVLEIANALRVNYRTVFRYLANAHGSR